MTVRAMPRLRPVDWRVPALLVLPGWHRAAGRVLAACGLVAAVTGLWMAHVYPWPAGDGRVLYLRVSGGARKSGESFEPPAVRHSPDVRSRRLGCGLEDRGKALEQEDHHPLDGATAADGEDEGTDASLPQRGTPVRVSPDARILGDEQPPLSGGERENILVRRAAREVIHDVACLAGAERLQRGGNAWRHVLVEQKDQAVASPLSNCTAASAWRRSIS